MLRYVFSFFALASLVFGADGDVQTFLRSNCAACHSAANKTADLDVESLAGAPVKLDLETWENIALKIRTGEMPPKGFPRPDEAAAKAVAEAIAGEIEQAERALPLNPGRVTARRLNRAEYNNSIRDLLGVALRPADDFPQDDAGYGFDNIGDVLSLSPVLMEKYLNAAEKSVRTAVFGHPAMEPTLVRFQPPYRDYPLSDKPEFEYDETGLSMPQALHFVHRFPVDGEYEFNVVPEGRRPFGSEPIQMALWVDGEMVGTMEVDAPVDNRSQDLFGQERQIRLRVSAGEHWIAGTVLKVYEGLPPDYAGPNPSKRPIPPPRPIERRPGQTDEEFAEFVKRIEKFRAENKTPANRSYIHIVEISGPFDGDTKPSEEARAKTITCAHEAGAHVEGCERQIVGDFARRAFRRPVTGEEIEPYLGLFEQAHQGGASFEEGIAGALQAVLVSPDFLFRIEQAGSPAPVEGAELLSQHELATRLSYFLWSSTPDDELLRLADAGKLRRPETLQAQVARMLRDPKAIALVRNFGGQWLETRRMESVTPDRDRFPEFEDYLRMSMERETDLLFQHIIREDRPILDFITADYTFLNERLAEHYGIEGVEGHEFRRVDLTGRPRSGVLGHASVLTVSSYANRTSPVLRGKWVLENILNAPPPPPPPGVPVLDEQQAGVSASLREQLEQHRSNATCASCHARMDPIGFGLENFDAIGKWRTKQGEFEIDAAGELPDGRTFDGPRDLVNLISEDRGDFTRAITEKMLIYALGRGLERYDRRTVREIAAAVAAQEYKFSSLVLEIVRSAPFQMRQGGPS
jgi:hypothetical protein